MVFEQANLCKAQGVPLWFSLATARKGAIQPRRVQSFATKQELEGKLEEESNTHVRSSSVAGVGTSGIKVETLQVRNEKYKPSQGVRYHTRGGRVVVRT